MGVKNDNRDPKENLFVDELDTTIPELEMIAS